MPIKLAITISGAVSLGTFEAGALYEVLKALENHNALLAENDPARIVVDVMTGASAGGMSAVIAAQKLLYNAADLSIADNNALYNAWVVGADLGSLLKHTPKEKKYLSILSSDCIQKIADRFILERPIAASNPHKSCADSIRVGLALSNLNGIDYSVNVFGGSVNNCISNHSYSVPAWQMQFATGQFTYTRFQDEITETLERNFDPIVWSRLKQAAISCGAFPFAFRAVELERPSQYYLNKGATGFPPTSNRYTFTDGGVFQNEPLGLAKNLVDEIDKHRNSDQRYYLYIAPGAKISSIEQNPLRAAKADVLQIGAALFKSILNQAKFQDWIMAEKINHDLALFDARVKETILEVKKARKNQGITSEQINAITSPILISLQNIRKAPQDPTASNDTLEEAKTRVRELYQDELKEFADDPALGESWLNIVLILELSAQLEKKDEMKIFAITARENELAGGKLFAFQGFFDIELRKHDYGVGRVKAREILRQLSGVINHGLQPTDDIEINRELDAFDILTNRKREQYHVLLASTVARALDYAFDPLMHGNRISRVLSRLLGAIFTFKLMHPVMFEVIIWIALILLGVSIGWNIPSGKH